MPRGSSGLPGSFMTRFSARRWREGLRSHEPRSIVPSSPGASWAWIAQLEAGVNHACPSTTRHTSAPWALPLRGPDQQVARQRRKTPTAETSTGTMGYASSGHGAGTCTNAEDKMGITQHQPAPRRSSS